MVNQWVQSEIAAIPDPPTCANLLKGIIGPEVLHLLCPCSGVLGAKDVFKNVNTKTETHSYDIDIAYVPILEHLQRDEIHSTAHMGCDILAVPLNELPMSDVVAAGPPCPPWAGHGNKKAGNDARSGVFIRVLMWLLHLMDHNYLKAFFIENVTGCNKAIGNDNDSSKT